MRRNTGGNFNSIPNGGQRLETGVLMGRSEAGVLVGRSEAGVLIGRSEAGVLMGRSEAGVAIKLRRNVAIGLER